MIKSDERIIDITMNTVAIPSPEVEYEYNTAIDGIIEKNSFSLNNNGPYKLRLSILDNNLVMNITDNSGVEEKILLSITPFRRIVKDYFLICENYYKAVREASPSKIETIDVARRTFHNEGSELLIERLNTKVEVDFNTARKLFTLICVLHIKRF